MVTSISSWWGCSILFKGHKVWHRCNDCSSSILSQHFTFQQMKFGANLFFQTMFLSFLFDSYLPQSLKQNFATWASENVSSRNFSYNLSLDGQLFTKTLSYPGLILHYSTNKTCCHLVPFGCWAIQNDFCPMSHANAVKKFLISRQNNGIPPQRLEEGPNSLTLQTRSVTIQENHDISNHEPATNYSIDNERSRSISNCFFFLTTIT